MGKQEELSKTAVTEVLHNRAIHSGTPSPRSGRQHKAWGASPRKASRKKGRKPVKRATAQSTRGCRPFHGLGASVVWANLGLAPQALCCHLLRRLRWQ